MKKNERSSVLILVVDDEAFMRSMMEEALEEDGFEVTTATGGQEALEKFQALEPDAILLDINMPDVDGFEVCRTIRQQPGGLHLPILMVTGDGEKEMIHRTFGSGATDFIAKPFNPVVLGYRVRYMLRATEVLQSLRHNQERLMLAQDIAGLGYWDWDLVNDVWNFSTKTKAILKSDAPDLAGFEVLLRAVHPDEKDAVRVTLERALAGETQFNFEHRIVWPDGQVRHVHSQAGIKRDPLDRPVQVTGTIHDITDRRLTEDQLYEKEMHLNYLAYHDALTGLPNRLLFQDRFQHAISRAKRSRKRVVILFLDLDRFKKVNDSLGHEIGDQLLREVALRLKSCAREEDTLARLGGDEFVLLLEELDQENAASVVAKKVIAQLARTFEVGGFQLYASASIGIGVYPDNGESVEELMKCADVAMYRAKERGRNGFQFYTPDMNARAQELLLLENSLRQALSKGQLEIYYQPQLDMWTGEFFGAEALIRWNHPEKGLLLPAEFLSLAEETGLIMSLTEWVLKTSCRQNQLWQEAGFQPLVLAVNITPRMFQQPELIPMVSKALEGSGLDPRYLELEVTESMIMQDLEATIRTMEELVRMGVSISIDDFGTGYSSLSCLRQLPIKKLKIDQLFVRDISSNPNDVAIAASVIALANSMNLGVIAEGVETKEQLKFLQDQGCRQGQGFLFSRPLPAAEVEKVFKK